MFNIIKVLQENNSTDELKNKINSLPIEQVANKLQLKLTKTGTSLQGECPTGHPSQSKKCFSINTQQNYHHCFHCGSGGDNIELIKISKGLEFVEALDWAKSEFNLDDISIAHSNSDAQNISNEQVDKEKQLKGMLYEKVYEYLHEKLFTEEGKEAFYYLTEDRKYDPEVLRSSEFCAFTTEKDIRKYLKEEFPDAEAEINSLPLSGASGDNFDIAIPYRDRFGKITGLMKRASEPEGITITLRDGTVKKEVRYDSTPGISKYDLFNLDKCKDQETLLIVEGYPDAAYLYAAGIKNIVAIGQAKLSLIHLEGLNQNNVKRVIISFDNDNVGPDNTEAAVKLLLDKTEIIPFVLEPSLLTPHKDPDELVRHDGLDALKSILDKVENGISWLVKRKISKYDLTKEIEKQEAFNVAISLELILRDDYDREMLIDSIAEHFSLQKETVRTQLKSFKEKSKKIEAEIKKLTNDSKELLKENNIVDYLDLIQKRSTEIKTNYGSVKLVAPKSFEVELQEMFLRDDTRDPNKLLGLPLTKFTELAKNIDGIQPGFYIIGAEPHIGKTALMTGLCLDVLDTNKDVKVIYYSLDDSSAYTAYRMLSIMTGIPINQVKRKQTIPADHDLLLQKREELIELVSSKRLVIKDLGSVSDVSELETDIKSIGDYSNLVVFIDGLFNLGVGNGGESIRVENIERANTVKTLVDSYGIPVFTTAELRKKLKTDADKKKPTMSDIMETGKFAYNANVIFLMYPDDPANMILPSPRINLEYAKNKLSDFRATQYLLFERTKGLISEYHLILGNTPAASSTSSNMFGGGDLND